MSLAALVITAGVALSTPAAAHPPASAEAYRWVVAPDWSPQREPAQGRHARVDPPLLEAGAASVWTPDFQAVVSLIADGPVRTPATVIITPVDPSSLPRPADGHPNGNAYRVQVSAPDWQVAVQVALATPFEATGVVVLQRDTWEPVSMQRGGTHVTASVPADAVVLAVADRVDGHDGRWDALIHDPVRWGLAAAATLAVAGRWWAVNRRRSGGSTAPMAR